MGNTKCAYFDGCPYEPLDHDAILRATHGAYCVFKVVEQSGYLGAGAARGEGPFVIGALHSFSTYDLADALAPFFAQGIIRRITDEE